MLSRLMTRKEQLILVFVGCSILAGTAAIFFHRSSATSGPPPEVAMVDAPAPEQDAIVPLAAGTPPPASETPALSAAQSATVVAEPEATVSELPEAAPALAESPAEEAPAPRTVSVSIAGAVARPGLYDLPSSARVDDLIRRAGGALPDARFDDINRAAVLVDGSTFTLPFTPGPSLVGGRVIVRPDQTAASVNPAEYTVSGARTLASHGAAAPAAPTPASTTPATTPPPPDSAGDGLIDLNNAPQEQLETLPGIGPKLAQEIIRYRETLPFKTVDDLDNVSGIGEKRLDAVRALVMVRPKRR